ncbi:MAG: T9SS type A sorting domain-containing protein [Ignavibacteriaceae bacterium]|nr:T9SS type A sorting domain-containing protein [Ignavibacteriaceae bacterium]
MYENGGIIDSSYYGIIGIAIDDVPMAPNTMMGIVTDSVASNRWELYDFMTSIAFDSITTDGDYRMYTCAGPFNILAGSTLVIDLAIVAGTSLEDLQANAQDAIDYWLIVPVEDATLTTQDFSLLQNYPNPFNPSTRITYSIPQTSKVVIKVFDVLGNEIETLINEQKPAGTYEITWYAEGLPSGVYFYQLQTNEFVETKKMILLK